MEHPVAKKNQIIFVIDYESLDTHIYSGEGKDLHLEGEIDHSKDGKKSITINVRIDLED